MSVDLIAFRSSVLRTPTVLRAGAKVAVRTLTEMTTKKKALQTGDHINIEVAEAVMVRNNIVLAVGTPGMGEVRVVLVAEMVEG